MRTERAPEEILKVAMGILGLEVADMMSREKTRIVCRAREAVVGAIYNLSSRQPSLHELSEMTGKRHHTTVIYQLRRYNRDWPPALRIMWEEAVVREADAAHSAKDPGSGRSPRATPDRRKGRSR